MDRIWLKSYPKGVPATIDVNEYASLRDVFDRVIAQFGPRPAYTCMGKSITFADLDAASAAFGAFLQGRGLKPGARVALMLPNILQYPVCLFGVLRAGYTVVNTNPLYTPRELEHQLSDSGAEVLVVVENFAHTVQEVVHRTPVRQVVVTSIGEMLGWKGPLVDFVLRHVKRMIPAWSLPGSMPLAEALDEGRRRKLERVPITHDDIAFLQYTGGTTGVAKGAMLLHRNIVANLLQASAWVKPSLGEERHVILTPLPLYHIFSLTANCLVFMTLGAENVLITNPRDIPGFVREMGRHRFTAITGVNTLFNALLNNAAFARLDFSSLRLTLGGGMAVQKAVAERWKKVTGVPLIEAYGLTETSPAATMNPLDLPEYNGAIGLPIPSTDVVLRDDAGHDVPLGDAGRDLHQGAAGDGRLLAPLRRDRQGARRGRLARDRRHRGDGRTRLRAHRRSQEGHDPRIRIQRLSERDRIGRRDASGGARVRRDRGARCEVGRGGQAVRGQTRSESYRGSAACALPGTADRLQVPALRGVPRRAAQVQRRQDSAPRAAR